MTHSSGPPECFRLPTNLPNGYLKADDVIANKNVTMVQLDLNNTDLWGTGPRPHFPYLPKTI